jgi:hypothetical protein
MNFAEENIQIYSDNMQHDSTNHSVQTLKHKKSMPSYLRATSLAPNLHHTQRPGVILAANVNKKSIIHTRSTSRHHRRTEDHREPLLAVTPLVSTNKLPIEINGMKLFYDPSLNIDDSSADLKKYFIDGCLYLIKDQWYNIMENFDATLLEKHQEQNTT